MQIAREQGYEFTPDEMQAAAEAVNSFDELTEEELEAVAGGTVVYPPIDFEQVKRAAKTGYRLIKSIGSVIGSWF